MADTAGRMVGGRFMQPQPGYMWGPNGDIVPINSPTSASTPPPQVSQMAINQAQQDLAGMPSMQQINQSAVAASDPFASQRGQYQNALANMMQGNFSPSDPSYDWRFKQGQKAVENSMAAKGYLGSGNILSELQNQGQGMASQEYNNQYQRLLPLTGATTGSPAAAGAITASMYDWRNNALANMAGGMTGLANAQPNIPAAQQLTPQQILQQQTSPNFNMSQGYAIPSYNSGNLSRY